MEYWALSFASRSLDCPDPRALAAFYADLLGIRVNEDSENWGGHRLFRPPWIPGASATGWEAFSRRPGGVPSAGCRRARGRRPPGMRPRRWPCWSAVRW
ncbi:VOC family protein [Streptomyces sp. NPDC006539]|uniref:VOC family protein n=1 Tax=Streptomyces TaxID=1883 RepID=UPI0033968389